MQILNLKEEPDHLNTLAHWHHMEWAYLNPDANLKERVEKMKTYLNSDFIPTTYIAIDDQLLGSAAIVQHDMDTRLELSPWLASVYVAPEFRGNGIGSKLVLHVMEQAKIYGIKTVYLFTPNRESFYIRLGWDIFEKNTYRGQEVTIMLVNLRMES